MNRAKLTPCRKVGLSRKKSTPSRTVDDFLTESITGTTPISVTPISIKQEQNSIIASNFPQQIEINYDTPCRQVGLSRKRKTLTPLSGIKTNRCKSITPSQPSPKVSALSKENMLMDVTNKKSQKQGSCAVLLSDKLSSSISPHINQINELEKSASTDNVMKPKDEESNTRVGEIFVKNSSEYDKKKEVNVEELNGHNVKYIPAIPENICVDEEVAFDNKGENEFIKVCYKNEKVNYVAKSVQNTKNKNITSKKPKFNRKIFDDDDDFEICTKKINSKNNFGRYETDVASLQKRVSNKDSIPFRKSLSVGNKKCKSASTSSEAVGDSSVSDCFVKLIQIENITKKTPNVLKSQELSDDDFDIFTSTPPIIRSNINDLEKQVKEKRNILEGLERAKMYRKLHDIKELKDLTSTWENGCKLALTDLLEQLNAHTEMNMVMLLKKLDIPKDFMPLSQ